MAREWREMAAEKQQLYRDREIVDKKRYQKEKLEWEDKVAKQAIKDGKPIPTKGGKKGKVREGPQRPSSAFFFFQADRRDALKKERPDLSHKMIISVSLTLFELPLIRCIGSWSRVERYG